MAEADMRRHAEHFLRVVGGYPYVSNAGIAFVGENEAVLALELAVELPNGARLAGRSETGVRAVEPVEVVLQTGYPGRCPSFRLRHDFPVMPHLAPSDGKSLPVPCLVDGSPDEFFTQHDLVDAGIMAIVDQMCIWLKRAATGRLSNAKHGWEPLNRAAVLGTIFIDREHILGERIRKDAGCVWLRSRYLEKLYRAEEETPGFWVSNDLAPSLAALEQTFPFEFETRKDPGRTVAAVLWPSQKAVSKDLLADDVTTLGQLEARADLYGMGDQLRHFVKDLERRFEAMWVSAPLPVAVVLCVRRPFVLMGRSSSIECVAYSLNVHRPRSDNPSPALRPDIPVFPLRQVDMPSQGLFRSMSGALAIPNTSIIGCGSVGSKVGMHLARTGARILAVTDSAFLQPHNMARHALARSPFPQFKAPELAYELGRLGATTRSFIGDIIPALDEPDDLLRAVPTQSGLLVNTTASRLVREALSGCAGGRIKARVAEVTLFGRGDGAFVFAEGPLGNPSLSQLEASLYATVTKRERQLLFDPTHGLTQVQIGDGCGSLTMPMTDARLSAMTAMATEELCRMVGIEASVGGQIAIGVRDRTGLSTNWRRIAVPAFHNVKVEGGDWSLDIADDVVRLIRKEIATYPTAETGGLLIGTCNSRLRKITVVGTLPAPEDSKRSATSFVLGTKGLKKMISQRFRDSGGSLFDVGTWHSHLSDQGASALDWHTANSLARERPPPAVLLISTPLRFLAITGTSSH
ncbi:hypothetical protein GHK29_02390 [Sinorhizobium medicae]|uniref:Mov34/MPN/PAD-1 family protein n=1 Tax=Sinorhizobium medicae TaxID=110321 RepID=UPI0011A3A53F|nr:Mov34/MPN/PAD-1 family protein [Sinorhizobium medicae]MQU73594.1 hypothetical protein [Sinorhizobium medicae]